jgi:predicted nucleotidyltransferase
MTTVIDIRIQDLNIVHAILKTVLPVEANVYVFGSRATGTTKRASDLDLAIDLGRQMTVLEAAALAEGFEESNLPYRVDVVDLQTVDTEFRAIIDRNKVKLPGSSL